MEPLSQLDILTQALHGLNSQQGLLSATLDDSMAVTNECRDRLANMEAVIAENTKCTQAMQVVLARLMCPSHGIGESASTLTAVNTE